MSNAKFEVGKSYRLRGGGVAGPLEAEFGFQYKFKARFSGSPGQEDGVETWTEHGVFDINKKGESSLDLVPGAIEDEPGVLQVSSPAAVDHFAFPCSSNEIGLACMGMTMRDWFAGKALHKVMLDHRVTDGPYSSMDDVAEESYAMADAMMRARGAKS